MIDAGKFRNIKDKTASVELAHLVSVEIFHLKAAASEMETVEVGRVILFERTD